MAYSHSSWVQASCPSFHCPIQGMVQRWGTNGHTKLAVRNYWIELPPGKLTVWPWNWLFQPRWLAGSMLIYWRVNHFSGHPLSKPEYVTNEISSCCGGFSSINHRKRARSASQVMILHCPARYTHTPLKHDDTCTHIHTYIQCIYIYTRIILHTQWYFPELSRSENIMIMWCQIHELSGKSQWPNPQSDQAKAASSAKALEAAFGMSFLPLRYDEWVMFQWVRRLFSVKLYDNHIIYIY